MNAEHEAIIKDLQQQILEDWTEEMVTTFFTAGYAGDVEIAMFHDSLGRWIRNNYNLWSIPWEPKIKDGVDYSPEHPDCVSMTIVEEVWRRGVPTKETK